MGNIGEESDNDLEAMYNFEFKLRKLQKNRKDSSFQDNLSRSQSDLKTLIED